MATPESDLGKASTILQNSELIRVLIVAFLVLVLQIPILLIHKQILARQATRDEAVHEITSRWGGEQRIFGPVVRVPWRERRVEMGAGGRIRETWVQHHATFLPETLHIAADAQAETRYRGIFEVPVYHAEARVSGAFRPMDFADWDVPPDQILWERAEVLLAVSDTRSLRDHPVLVWDGASIPFEPGGQGLPDCGDVLTAPIPDLRAGEPGTFEIDLRLGGATRLSFAPVGDTTAVELSSNWPDPSFQGRWLPSERSVGPQGFEASWQISHLGRGYPSRWQDGAIDALPLRQAEFGAGFLAPVDPYRMAERSVKYELLFLALPFLAIWLFEVLGGLRVHPIQYLFLGAALCLFYLLQLSLAEHLGFALAYTLAGGSVAVMATLYSKVLLGAGSRAAIIGGLLVSLYVYLFVLLQEQDYALLLGSVGLFIALGVSMWVTRRIDWYALEGRSARS